jgi:hypothetical protein
MTDTPNVFQQHATRTISSVRKRQIEKAKAKDAMVPKTAVEKKQAEADRLHELWLAGQAKRKQKLLDGPFGGSAKALCAVLDKIDFDSGETLIAIAETWRGTPREVRFQVLQLIDEAMIDLRERNGMTPFDDPIDLDETNCFLTCRSILT